MSPIKFLKSILLTDTDDLLQRKEGKMGRVWMEVLAPTY